MKRGLIAVAAALALAIALWWWLRREEAGSRAEAAAAAQAPPAARPATPATPPEPAPPAPVVARPNELPRPVRTSEQAPPPVPVMRAFEERRHAPVDKRGETGPRAASELEIVSYAFETLDDDIEQCLEEWRKQERVAPAEVMLGFEIDANGLQRSWVDTDAGVPFGVRSCFANAVYGLDWSHIVEKPAMLTNRYNLGDAGR